MQLRMSKGIQVLYRYPVQYATSVIYQLCEETVFTFLEHTTDSVAFLGYPYDFLCL